MNKFKKGSLFYKVAKFLYRTICIIRYTIIRPWLHLKYGTLKVVDFEASLNELVNTQKSMARFGDGELRWALNIPNKNSFQSSDVQLASRLQEIARTNQENLMICVPDVFNKLNMYTWDNQGSWAKILIPNYKKWMQLLPKVYKYYDANITRPYIQRRDKSLTNKYFEKFKSVWMGKKVLIVEGRLTRFGVGNDLLKSAESIQRIICPEINAFDKYDEIFKSIKNISANFDLVLLALGPTATVLAYDLSRKDIRAIDIGHLDVEYEWYLRGVKEKVPISGKFVNELPEQKYVENQQVSTSYFSEILKTIV